ncbi:hypothetical protein Pmani_028286 [Petrolisthes manimaculis]|uniref:Peptide chain release factor N(5)-glutamine methyltransferase n=1 Tax=Petrolisthes manimaculis TaxID=1843537 RepID=A0AAE1P126_9EUCA|nr:hypothetical protein Pmani_028286 [Petrolisthes manimaculis]
MENWTGQLENGQVPEATLAAQYIISHTLGLSRAELKRNMNTVLSRQQLSEVERRMTCRLERMPLQYIIGEWTFRNLTLNLQPPVFIPRPETEQLVDLALECLAEVERPRVLEICCGSGAVCLSLLHAKHDVECVAVDQSQHAIRLTKENARKLNLQHRLTVLEGKVKLNTGVTDTIPPPYTNTRDTTIPLDTPRRDTTTPTPPPPSTTTPITTPTPTPTITTPTPPITPIPLPHTTYDLVLANPPYVLRKDLMNLQPEIMMYEDLRALDGGKDGLDVIKAILHLSHTLLLQGSHLILEVDPCHPYLIPTWLQKQPQLKMKMTKVYVDFSGKERFIKFTKCS